MVFGGVGGGGTAPQTFFGQKMSFSSIFALYLQNVNSGVPINLGVGSPPLGVATALKFFFRVLDAGWLDDVNHTLLGWT